MIETYEAVGFVRKISPGQCFETIHDLDQFLYLRAIQKHSGSTINPALQDNVLLPEDSPFILVTSETAKN